ncbi:MAG: nitrate/nitrite transporter NrtS [Thermoleophilia bacterium]|nr:nitrate/nitrite transporter NrtS [Thermoleophilia bacterium]
MADAIRYCLEPRHLRRTIAIAIVVGTILTAINHGDTYVAGESVTSTWVKTFANYLVPFVVSNLGLLTGRPG